MEKDSSKGKSKKIKCERKICGESKCGREGEGWNKGVEKEKMKN